VDLDLNGFPGDAGLLVRHLEPVGADPKVAHDTVTPFNGGKEGSAGFALKQALERQKPFPAACALPDPL